MIFLGMFAWVARGPGCAPEVQFTCLVAFAHPTAHLPVAKSTPSTWLPGYARIHRFSRAWLSAAHGGQFGEAAGGSRGLGRER